MQNRKYDTSSDQTSKLRLNKVPKIGMKLSHDYSFKNNSFQLKSFYIL